MRWGGVGVWWGGVGAGRCVGWGGGVAVAGWRGGVAGCGVGVGWRGWGEDSRAQKDWIWRSVLKKMSLCAVLAGDSFGIVRKLGGVAGGSCKSLRFKELDIRGVCF